MTTQNVATSNKPTFPKKATFPKGNNTPVGAAARSPCHGLERRIRPKNKSGSRHRPENKSGSRHRGPGGCPPSFLGGVGKLPFLGEATFWHLEVVVFLRSPHIRDPLDTNLPFLESRCLFWVTLPFLEVMLDCGPCTSATVRRSFCAKLPFLASCYIFWKVAFFGM